MTLMCFPQSLLAEWPGERSTTAHSKDVLPALDSSSGKQDTIDYAVTILATCAWVRIIKEDLSYRGAREVGNDLRRDDIGSECLLVPGA